LFYFSGWSDQQSATYQPPTITTLFTPCSQAKQKEAIAAAQAAAAQAKIDEEDELDKLLLA
jgi:hypothetical protein